MKFQTMTSRASHQTMRERIQSEKSVLLYGAGTIGRDSLAVLLRAGVLVEAFMDAKQLPFSEIHGVPILSPDSSNFSVEKRREMTVVVTIFNAYVHMPSIHAQLEALGWKKVVTFMAFYEAFFMELGDRYWLTNRDYYQTHTAQLDAARSLWADDKSRSVFDGIMRFRLTGDYEALYGPDLDTQYFPLDLPKWGLPLRLIDCGAYDGDTLRQVRVLELPLDMYAGFEPDIANFSKLCREVHSGDMETRGLTMLWPCGTWSHACQQRFASGHGSGSAVSSHGDTMIQCVSLDDALPSFVPNLIKMDIEGAELAALLGASRMIKTHRPGLAICLYHEPAHLWQVPLLLENWNLGYRFYLRCHCHNGFELVLYAVSSGTGQV
jgi:FkbM family methyltransferase